MSTEGKRKRSVRAGPPPVLADEDPLLRILVAKAATRGQPLKLLAKELGVTYGRLAQWRREKAAMKSAHRSVHARAARYLGVPTVVCLALAGVVGLEDFVWPERESLDSRLRRQLEEMRHDPFIAPFLPPSLAAASPDLRLFIVFLYRQATGIGNTPQRGQPWMTELHQAVVALQALQTTSSPAAKPVDIF